MNAIKQYIALHDEHLDTINTHSPATLNEMRTLARDLIEKRAFPKKGSEGYEMTDLNEIFSPDYGVNITRRPWGGDRAFGCDVPNLSTCLYYVVNDVFEPREGAVSNAGVVVTSLSQAAANYPHLLAQCYGKIADINGDINVTLNTLLAQDGVLIYIPDGVVAEKPIQIVNICNAAMPTMAVRRMLIVAGENSQARVLVCDHSVNHSTNHLATEVVEIVALKGATLDYYHMEETNEHTRRVSSLYAKQGSDTNVLIDGITLTNGITRNNYFIDVNGEHAETRLLGMTIATGTQHVDTYTHINHLMPRCKSNEMFKYVLNDNAVGAFAGKILVNPNCPRVEAYQGNRNICASPTAKMHTKPQLEIYTDDVKCSHGATIGQLDREAMFYMQTRGISVAEAQRLLMQAFVSDVIDGVRLEALKDRLHYLVERRFSGGDKAGCSGCNTTCSIK